MVALFDGKTTMWDSVPPGAAVVVFFVLMCIVGMLEGMQIAFFAVAKLRESERGSNVFARKTCGLLYSGDGHNLPGFMIGRQLCVVSCMLFVARVTSVDMKGEANLFGVSDGFQGLFNTGLLGAVMLTILGSISWQLVASARHEGRGQPFRSIRWIPGTFQHRSSWSSYAYHPWIHLMAVGSFGLPNCLLVKPTYLRPPPLVPLP